ncbi:MAG: fibronectin type III domain-containing protein [Flavobacteriales bacterium]|nr:fibronectin type III domain-containing protein [Flavobacteriales bacterium]
MKSNIKLSLYKLIPIALLALVRNVITKLTGNAFFPTPVVSLATMTAKADEFEVAIQAATAGSRQSKLMRDALALDIGEMLRAQADYVRSVCLGDRVMLESSGFDLRKQPERIGLPGTPEIKIAKMTGKQGQAQLRWTGENGTSAYHVWMTDKDPAEFSSWAVVAITTKVNHTVDNLESYKPYWFAISAIGAAGEGLKSDPAIVRAA